MNSVAMKSLQLESLLGDRYPEASFHDSEIEGLSVDFGARKAQMTLLIPIGVEGRKLVFRRGVLQFSELHSFSAENPKTLLGVESDRLWVTWDGALPDPGLATAPEVPKGLPATAFCHAFFISSTNSFIVVAAEEARFAWND
jgi:hypothetical protein